MALFSKLNKEQLFTNFDASIIANKPKEERYITCADLYKSSRKKDTVHVIHAAFINAADGEHEGSKFADETAVVALDDVYLNVPQHQLEEVKILRNDPEMVAAVNACKAGVKIKPYTMDKYPGETFYKIEWVDIK